MVGLYTNAVVCLCQRSDAESFIKLSLSLTLSLWASAVAFLVPLVLQVLFSFAVVAFQRECSKGGGKGFFPISQEGRGLEKSSVKALHRVEQGQSCFMDVAGFFVL